MSCIKALKTGKKPDKKYSITSFQGIYEALCKNTQIMGSVLEILLTQVIISLTSGRHSIDQVEKYFDPTFICDYWVYPTRINVDIQFVCTYNNIDCILNLCCVLLVEEVLRANRGCEPPSEAGAVRQCTGRPDLPVRTTGQYHTYNTFITLTSSA